MLYDGAVRGPGTGDRISDALDEAFTALMTWAKALAGDREFPRPYTLADAVIAGDLSDETKAQFEDDQAAAFRWLCAGLDFHLVSISTLEWCGEMVRELDVHESKLRRLTEASIPGWYAGRCTRRVSMDARCGTPTYVVPGLTWVTCSGCGATTYARDHLETVINEAKEWVGSPRRVAEAVVALVDTEQSVTRLHDRIRQWSTRGDKPKLTAIQRVERDHVWSDAEQRLVVADVHAGPKRYRLGDVLDLLAKDGATRVGRDVETTDAEAG